MLAQWLLVEMGDEEGWVEPLGQARCIRNDV
jgi:hypothetical protein